MTDNSHNFTTKDRPPANTRRIMRVADQPQERGPAQYEITNGDLEPCVFTLSKRQRQVLDLLISAPTYCASPVRIGDAVHIMKREIGLEIETNFYPGNAITGAGAYGVYFLKSQVRNIDQCEVPG